MRSGEAPARVRAPLAVLAALGAAGSLAGCATTMQEAARLQLNSARIRASQVSTRVSSPNPRVPVVRLSVLTAGGRSAFVVQVRDDAGRAVSDLPISVGYRSRAGASPTYLNASDALDFFDAHLPAIEPGRTVTWVFADAPAIPAGARPFALVGTGSSTGARPVRRLPLITADARPAAGGLTVALDNRSSVPQYQLQVYAVARRGGDAVAAGSVTVAHLGTGSTRTIQLPLLGSLSRASVQVEALPTIFQ